MKILVINKSEEDGKDLISFFKEKESEIDFVSSYREAFGKIDSSSYDCIVASMNEDKHLCRQLLEKISNENRQEGFVIFSGTIPLSEKLELFMLGADDHLVIPFENEELFARVSAVVRRKKFNTKTKLYFANLVIDFQAKRVVVWNNPISLTKKEYEILLHLIANKNKVMSKESLSGYLWSDNYEKSGSYDFLFAHLKNLKKKLKSAKAELVIKNIYGVGYQIEET